MSAFLQAYLRRIAGVVLDFVYPPLCHACGKLLLSGGEQICPACWSSIKRVECDLALFHETRSRLMESCLIDDLISLYVFEKEGSFQAIAHALKYSGIQSLGLELGRRLGEAVKEQGIDVDLLVPVPLHRRRFRERGYNQAELISRGVSVVLGVPQRLDLVRRAKWTQTQTTLSRDERDRNVRDAFECSASGIDGMVVMIVDDVITTGATIVACAEMLKKAGVKRIIAASAALAQKDAA